MTGNWSYEAGKHARVSFSLTNGLVLHFTDVRNFGTLKVQTTVDFVARRAALGPDVLKSPVAAVSGRIYDFRYAFQQDGRSVTLVEALMDQRILAGVGNYLKSEILFAAKLSPHRQLSSLTDDEIAALATEIVRIPQESYRLGGTTLRNYHAPDGEPGRFSEILKVYGKNGHGIKKETTADKRTTFWVPSVQV
jgi:formamidopyrimidine-DNA glycosylase